MRYIRKLQEKQGLLILILLTVSVLSAPPSAYPLTVNDKAPLFFLRDSEGGSFFLSDYIREPRKEKTNGIILSFFSSTCIPCKKELPVLNAMTDELKTKGVKIVVIGFKEDFDRITDFLSGLKVDKPTIMSDRYGKVGEKYGVRGLPTTFFIGPDGRIKEVILGELPDMENRFREKVRKAFIR
jgi:peroxiredoxin